MNIEIRGAAKSLDGRNAAATSSPPDQSLLPEVLGDGGERSQRTKLGKALGRMRDRIIGTYRIVSEREDGKGRRLYRLEPTELPT
jgi:hypothetical protein